jgi:hypothetical protein
MLRRLGDRFAEQGACMVLGIPVLTFRAWLAGRARPTAAAVRCIWLVHALLLRPGLVTSAFDLITWGRFKSTGGSPSESAFELASEDWSV